MEEIFRVTVQGRTLESRDLRKLLARAVREKKDLDQRRRVASSGNMFCASGLSLGDGGSTTGPVSSVQ